MRIFKIYLLFWVKSTKEAQNFIEIRDEIKKAKFNSIKFKQLICAKVKSFVLNIIYNNFIISYLSSIPSLANRPYNSIFNANFAVACGGGSFE